MEMIMGQPQFSEVSAHYTVYCSIELFYRYDFVNY
jgi:hypothetical protein